MRPVHDITQVNGASISPRKVPAGRRVLALLGAAALIAGGTSSAYADTLAEAIALAYQNNPTLKVQRAQLEALDEQFVQASQNLRPQLSFDGVLRNTKTQIGGGGGNLDISSGTVGLSATQVLSTFGRTAAQISVAEARVLSEREGLRQQESNIILSVIESYAAVRRDEANVDVARQAVAAFRGQGDQARARLKAGDSTLTDTSQSEAQLASTEAALAQAQAVLQQSRAAYARLVGQNPGTLEPLPPLPNMPKAVQEAYDAAEDNSPTILQAVLAEKSGRAAVQAAKAEFRPTLAANSQLAFSGATGVTNSNPFARENVDREFVGGLSFSVPIFTGGFIRSRVREAQANDRALVANIEVARRQVVENVSVSWNRVVTAERQYQFGQQAVRAAQQSTKGARLEFDEGFRSFFEVLNEQQRLLEAQNLVTAAEYNRFVGQASVLNAIGQLDANKLVVDLQNYDAKAKFDKVSRKGSTPLDPFVELIDRATGPRLPRAPVLTTQPVPAGARSAPAVDVSVSDKGLATSVPTQGDTVTTLISGSSNLSPK